MFTKERNQSHLWTSCSCEWILILAPNSFPWHSSAKFSRSGICPWVDQIIGGGNPPTPCTLLNPLLSLCLSVSSSHPHHGVSGLAFYPSPYFPSLSHPSPFGLPLPQQLLLSLPYEELEVGVCWGEGRDWLWKEAVRDFKRHKWPCSLSRAEQDRNSSRQSGTAFHRSLSKLGSGGASLQGLATAKPFFFF